jgi:hypothetical protein
MEGGQPIIGIRPPMSLNEAIIEDVALETVKETSNAI